MYHTGISHAGALSALYVLTAVARPNHVVIFFVQSFGSPKSLYCGPRNFLHTRAVVRGSGFRDGEAKPRSGVMRGMQMELL